VVDPPLDLGEALQRSDLYCPGFNPRESLAKDSNLAAPPRDTKSMPQESLPRSERQVAERADKKSGDKSKAKT
jgi:hypothetical protein